MNLSHSAVAVRLITEGNPVWAWAIAVATVGLLIAALMVLVQESGRPGRRTAIWGVVIFVLPIIGPAVYLISETVRYRRKHGRPEKGMVEKYAPEEVAQRREQARRDEAQQERTRRTFGRGDDTDSAAD